jgi:hypothetical protein
MQRETIGMSNGFDINSFRQGGLEEGAVDTGGAVFSEPVSWSGSILESFKGALFGLLMVPVACIALFFGEGLTIETAEGLDQGRAMVKEAAAAPIDPTLEARLVHVTGPVATGAKIVDGRFGVAVAGLQLSREVEMYQWKEERRTVTIDGQKRTEFHYHKAWDAQPISSRHFRRKAAGDHVNPDMPFGSERFPAPDARLGAYAITPAVMAKLPDGPALLPTPEITSSVAQALNRPAREVEGAIFVGEDANAPAVGDLRIRYKLSAPSTATAVAGQFGQTLAPHQALNGVPIAILRPGALTSDQMFSAAKAENSMQGWMIRAGGTVFVFFGFLLIVRPLATLASFVPILGGVVSAGTTFAAAAMTILVAPLVVALAWLWYAPVFSILLIGGAVAAFAGLRELIARRRTTPAPPPVILRGRTGAPA